MTDVTFIDTSVLCNILPVPGRCQKEGEARDELSRRLATGELFVLPVAAVVETGNFVAQVADGQLRRRTAALFAEMLRLVAEEQAPWVLHEFAWNRGFLLDLVAGSGTQCTLVDHAVAGVGAGDLSILQEMRAYAARSQTVRVSLWTYDHALAAYGRNGLT